MNSKDKTRCPWALTPPNTDYHDQEWGRPVHDDRVWFEFLILEGAQAGLSWTTILKRRENYRKAFSNFDIHKIIKYDENKIIELMNNEGIIRNQLKIRSVVSNAEAFIKVQKEFGSFDCYIWKFVDGKPLVKKRKSFKDVPAKTAESDALSKDLKKRGFKFVGSTICYAWMQACGLVNDHTQNCFLSP
jgi:DNA-3-methyladenine glycosylase I